MLTIRQKNIIRERLLVLFGEYTCRRPIVDEWVYETRIILRAKQMVQRNDV